MKKKVVIIQGGMSSENEVSSVTGKGFAEALKELGWPFEVLNAGPDLPEKLQKIKADVALLALHGKYGEDGTVQGICEYLKLPYTGSGVLASALSMDKIFFKELIAFHKIPTAKYEVVDARHTNLDEYQTKLKYPVVVKPSRDGSSQGVSIVKNAGQMAAALKLAQPLDYEILIEDYIDGMELTVPILVDRALTGIEIVPKVHFYDYKNKYTAGNTEYILPPRLEPSVQKLCADISLKVFEVTKCRTYGRVDFRLDSKFNPYVMEINTLPGCTPTSLLPKSAAHSGISFPQLIKTLVEKAGLDYEGLR